MNPLKLKHKQLIQQVRDALNNAYPEPTKPDDGDYSTADRGILDYREQIITKLDSYTTALTSVQKKELTALKEGLLADSEGEGNTASDIGAADTEKTLSPSSKYEDTSILNGIIAQYGSSITVGNISVVMKQFMQQGGETLSECIKAMKSFIIHQKLALYVPPEGRYQADDKKSFGDLYTKVCAFLQNKTHDVLLLLGDSGSGKSLFGQFLVQALWKDYQPTKRVPLFIDLPTIDNPIHDLLDKHLKKQGFSQEKIGELKKEPLVLVLDGYDEIYR